MTNPFNSIREFLNNNFAVPSEEDIDKKKFFNDMFKDLTCKKVTEDKYSIYSKENNYHTMDIILKPEISKIYLIRLDHNGNEIKTAELNLDIF